MDLFGYIGWLFGWVLWFCFYLVKNYGLAIILFTIFVKLLMFPLTIKQQKSMAANAKLSSKQAEIKKKYGNNQQKYSEEINKLYAKEGVSPTSGCLPMLIPMILLLGVYWAVVSPLTNTLHFDSTTVNNAVNQLTLLPGVGNSFTSNYSQMDIINIAQCDGGSAFLSSLGFNAGEISDIIYYSNGFNMFGLNLLGKPSDVFAGGNFLLILIPVLCFLSSVLSQMFTMKIQNNAASQQGCMKVMMFVLPLFSAWISYSVPAAVGFYWIISTVISFAQTVVLQKFYNVHQMTAQKEASHVALMEIEEAKIKYYYQPRFKDFSNDNNKKKNKKK